MKPTPSKSMRKVLVAYLEETDGGFRAIQYIDTKRCVISVSRKRESLIRFLAQNGFRIISEETSREEDTLK